MPELFIIESMSGDAADDTKGNISIVWSREGDKGQETVIFYHGSGPKNICQKFLMTTIINKW